jgi:hypothetical protein
MKNKVVAVVDSGITYATLVSVNTKETSYGEGLRLGPPEEFRTLKTLSKTQLGQLSEKLFAAGIYEAQDFINRRPDVFRMLTLVGVPAKQQKSVLRSVISVYQRSDES